MKREEKLETNSELPLNPVESEAVQLFGRLAHALGQRRSVGEIYGLLFFSPLPLSYNDVKERLALSSGSASQGLTLLREMGAVREVAAANQRRAHFEAVAELRNLAGSFLRRQIATQFSDSGPRLKRIQEHSRALPGEARDFIQVRLKLLQSWEKNGQRVLPFLLKMLGGK